MVKKGFQRRRISRDRSDRHEQGVLGRRRQERGDGRQQDAARSSHRGSLEARHESRRRQGRRLPRAGPALVQVRRLTAPRAAAACTGRRCPSEAEAGSPATAASADIARAAPRPPSAGSRCGRPGALRAVPPDRRSSATAALLAEEADHGVLALAVRERGGQQLLAIGHGFRCLQHFYGRRSSGRRQFLHPAAASARAPRPMALACRDVVRRPRLAHGPPFRPLPGLPVPPLQLPLRARSDLRDRVGFVDCERWPRAAARASSRLGWRRVRRQRVVERVRRVLGLAQREISGETDRDAERDERRVGAPASGSGRNGADPGARAAPAARRIAAVQSAHWWRPPGAAGTRTVRFRT